MSNQRVTIIAVVVALVFFVLGMLVSAAAGNRTRTEPAKPPDIGGQPVPDVPLSINFDKRYDVHCILLEQEPTVFKDVKIVGFTGPKEMVTDTATACRVRGRDTSSSGLYWS